MIWLFVGTALLSFALGWFIGYGQGFDSAGAFYRKHLDQVMSKDQWADLFRSMARELKNGPFA